jgi:predicted ATPase
VGEAGVGKSRLLWEFRQTLSPDSLYLEGRCLHFGESMPYLPILDLLRSYFNLREGDREHLIKRKMAERVSPASWKRESIDPGKVGKHAT